MDNPKILVIDGDPKNLQILKESLESAKFRVITTASGEDGWMLVQSEKPNIIVSEVDIPGLDGFQLLERLQKNPVHAAIPLVFLTNRRNLEDRIKSLRTGVKDYMIKPLHVKEVIARLQMILRRMERLRTDESDTSRKIVGRLEDQSVEQLLENYGIEKRTGVLSLYDSFDRSGEIYFRAGAVVNARLGNFRAEKAVYQMLPWDRGHYIMTFKDVNVPPEITVSNLGLLLQGYKRMQEREKLLKQLPDEQAVMVKTPLFEQILKRKPIGQDALKFIALFDGKRTVAQVLAESANDDVKTLNRILRLYEQGFIQILGATPRIPNIKVDKAPSVVPKREPRPSVEMPKREITKPYSAEKLERPPFSAPENRSAPKIKPIKQHSEHQDFEADVRKQEIFQKKPEQTKETGDFVEVPRDQAEINSPIPSKSGQSGSGQRLKSAEPGTEHQAQENGNGSSTNVTSQPAAPVLDSLFNGGPDSVGHFVVLSNNQRYRQQFISSLTSGRYTSKNLGDWNELIELGHIATSKRRSVEIIGLSTEQKFVRLLEQVSKSLVGYVVLIKGDNPSSLKYTGYLVDTIRKKIEAPHVIALIRTGDGRRVPLDFVRYSLQLEETEQIVEVDATDINSLLHAISQLKPPEYLQGNAKQSESTLQSAS